MNYEVTFKGTNFILAVVVFVDYEEETEDFDFLVIEDACAILSRSIPEFTSARIHELASSIDVDRK